MSNIQASFDSVRAYASDTLRPLVASKSHGFAFAAAALLAALVVRRTIAQRRAAAKWRAGKGKKSIAVVTGGSSGIGLAIVQGFLAKGYTVAVLDLAPPPLTDQQRMHFCKTDITDVDEVGKAREEIKSKFGAVDVIVNNVRW